MFTKQFRLLFTSAVMVTLVLSLLPGRTGRAQGSLLLTSPTLTSPANGTEVYTVRPTFLWDDNPDATGYLIQISKTTTFETILHKASSTDPTYTPPVNLPANRVLHWRVRATSAKGPSGWSDIWGFTTGNPPSVPVLLAPENKALVKSYDIMLDWKNSTLSIGTFKHYQIQINDSQDFTTQLVDATTTPGDVLDSDYPATITANTKYYWRVRSISTIGTNDHVSGWSQVWIVRAAIMPASLTTPTNDALLNNKRPTLDWEDVDGAAGYKVLISKHVDMSQPIRKVSTVESVYALTADLPARTKLYWQVQAMGPNGPSRWSETWNFTTGNPPSVPLLGSPADNAVVTDPLRLLNWSISKLPAGTKLKNYEIQIDDNPDFSSTFVNTTMTISQYTATFSPNTKYYWRVRAVGTVLGEDQFSAWSDVRSVRAAILPPTPLTPSDNAASVLRRPVLDWSDVADNSGYTLQVWKGGPFPALIKTVTLPANVSKYAFVDKLLPNTAYFWMVRTRATNGPSAWSTPFDFTTVP